MDFQQVNIQAFPTSSKNETFLLEVSGRFFEIGQDTAELLMFLKEHGGSDKSIERYVTEHGGKPTKEEISTFIESMEKKTSTKDDEGDKRKSFLYSRDFISSESSDRLTSMLGRLFNRWIMVPVIMTFMVLEVAYFFFFNETREYMTISIYALAGMYLFLILSSLVHEFGHASACRHFGAPHGNIGLGLYLNLPVFYTDVSHVWKLSRRQRCVVNFGGVYFQMLLLIPLLASGIAWGNNLLRYMIVLMNLNFLITMNPFFKFDGYWMMTDLLGVANLRQKGNEWMAYVWRRMRGMETGTRPYLLSLTRWARYGLVAYTAVVSLFFGFYFLYVIPRFFVRFYNTFPDRFRQLMAELSYRQMPEWSNMQQIGLQLVFLFFFIYMAYRMLNPLIRRMQWTRK